MDFELLGSPGWREGLIAIIALLVLYLIVLFFRLWRLQQAPSALPPLVAQSAVAAYTAIQDEAESTPAAASAAPAALAGETAASLTAPASVAAAAAGKREFPWNEPPLDIPGQAMIDGLQREVYQLRCEVDQLRGEVLAAREDLRRQSVPSPGVAQSASPIYTDAMEMAIQGHDATTIAHRCGIARAEADLVVALARNRRDGI
jgi:hypothetical protein